MSHVYFLDVPDFWILLEPIANIRKILAQKTQQDKKKLDEQAKRAKEKQEQADREKVKQASQRKAK